MSIPSGPPDLGEHHPRAFKSTGPLPGKDTIMNTLFEKISRRIFTKYMLLDMLQMLSRKRDDLGPFYRLWTENPDEARPVILRLMLHHPATFISAIVDSIRYHYY